MVRLVEGIGINDRKYPTTNGEKSAKEYVLWTSMLRRCYNNKWQLVNSTYIGCTVSNNFKQYSLFYEWCQTQIGFSEPGYQLDKDLIIKGNKIYSEHNCIFIPKTINSLLLSSNSCRGALPIGVTKNNDNYQVNCSVDGKQKYLGTYNTPELAFNAYKTFKEAHIKELAEKYKETIDPRAYQALMNYEVDIND